MALSRRSILASLAGALSARWFPARAAQADSVRITDAWARPTPKSAPTGAVYMKVRNAGHVDLLIIGMETSVASRTEIHRTVRSGDVARMAPVKRLPLPAGAVVAFHPGEMHVMLLDLQGPIVAGRSFPIRLVLEDESTVTATVEVRTRAPQQGKDSHHS